jgi:hypothetical protein
MKDVTELTCRYHNNYHNYCDDENNYMMIHVDVDDDNDDVMMM